MDKLAYFISWLIGICATGRILWLVFKEIGDPSSILFQQRVVETLVIAMIGIFLLKQFIGDPDKGDPEQGNPRK